MAKGLLNGEGIHSALDGADAGTLGCANAFLGDYKYWIGAGAIFGGAYYLSEEIGALLSGESMGTVENIAHDGILGVIVGAITAGLIKGGIMAVHYSGGDSYRSRAFFGS